MSVRIRKRTINNPPVTTPSQLDEEQLRRQFLEMGRDFFSINSHKNVPDILDNLKVVVGYLYEAINQARETINKAGESSERLANALNKLTLWAVIIALFSLLIAGGALAFEIYKFRKENKWSVSTNRSP
jgi:hypothetical protein